MCGIVGAVSERNIEKILLDGLKRLEYRGYDSAGLAVISQAIQLKRLRTLGKVKNLEDLLIQQSVSGKIGIAHTRWATHGVPAENNAHPFISQNEIALVHNGIIENHEKLRTFLTKEGYTFSSDTDSETIVHLLHHELKTAPNLLKAIQKTTAQLEGAYALGILCLHYPDRLWAVRHGSPLVIGKGIHENFFASDPLALLGITREFIYLEEGDIAEVSDNAIQIDSMDGKSVERKIHQIDMNLEVVERGKHRHFMSKEIFEQPQAVITNLEGRLSKNQILDSAFGLKANDVFSKVQHVQLVACGTSYHAVMVAKYWLESLAGIPCSVEIASEFRYRKSVVQPNSLFVCLSQSGETADTLAALKLAKNSDYLSTLAICNVPESSLMRESALQFMMRAGIEIGVASTKAFTAQLVDLLLLTFALGRKHQLKAETEQDMVQALQTLPQKMQLALESNDIIAKLASRFLAKEHVLFLGRGALYPIALEGALKLKEISYIHAEGYPAGELKHGPLALVDANMPVIAIAPHDDLLEKLKSNLSEVRARGGELYIFSDTIQINDPHIHIIRMPTIDPILAPILYSIPMQLLAYHVAVLKGTDVDQPRNLAKSVTVE